MIELHYETVARALESWDIARGNCKDFEKEFGSIMINKWVTTRLHSRNCNERCTFHDGLALTYPRYLIDVKDLWNLSPGLKSFMDTTRIEIKVVWPNRSMPMPWSASLTVYCKHLVSEWVMAKPTLEQVCWSSFSCNFHEFCIVCSRSRHGIFETHFRRRWRTTHKDWCVAHILSHIGESSDICFGTNHSRQAGVYKWASKSLAGCVQCLELPNGQGHAARRLNRKSQELRFFG